MKLALGQFAVSRERDENLQICLDLMFKAADGGADLLVLPEGVLARDIADPMLVVREAQSLDGPFVSKLLEASKASTMTTITCIHTPGQNGKVSNTLIVVRNGKLLATYRKLHLYDAFSAKESINVEPGADIPPVLDVAGVRVGVMTCYDVRFPELARNLAISGADLVVVPAAWVKGPLKEMHWHTTLTARALDNTIYVAGCGECGERNVGCSMVVDPLGVPIVSAAESAALIYADVDLQRLAYAREVLPVLTNRRFDVPILRQQSFS